MATVNAPAGEGSSDPSSVPAEHCTETDSTFPDSPTAISPHPGILGLGTSHAGTEPGNQRTGQQEGGTEESLPILPIEEMPIAATSVLSLTSV